VAGFPYRAQGGPIIQFDYPYPGTCGTEVHGVSGNTVVGSWYCAGPFPAPSGGFSYTVAGGYQLIDEGSQTFVTGISGNTIVGYVAEGAAGFIDDAGVRTYLQIAGDPTEIWGISGNTIAGYVSGGSGFAGPIGGPYTPVADPQAAGGNTAALAVSGNTVGGQYTNGGVIHGFIETNGAYTTIDDPFAVGGTTVTGISGDCASGPSDPSCTIAGTYYGGANGSSPHGFIESAGVFATFDVPGALNTTISGINGCVVFGSFNDARGTHGFVTTPEPSGFLLFCGLAGLVWTVSFSRRAALASTGGSACPTWRHSRLKSRSRH
jgi:hypothetical protein